MTEAAIHKIVLMFKQDTEENRLPTRVRVSKKIWGQLLADTGIPQSSSGMGHIVFIGVPVYVDEFLLDDMIVKEYGVRL